MMEDVRKTFQDHKHILHFMDIVHFMHMVKEKNEGLLDDQKRKVTGKSTQIYHQTIKFIPLSPKISLTTQMLK